MEPGARFPSQKHSHDMFGSKSRRRRKLMEQPLPPEWLAIIERNVEYYHHLTDEDRSRLGGLTRIFLDETIFEGAGGLELTDEIRVTIAAQACLLLLGLEQDTYADLRTVIVYPGAFVVPYDVHLGDWLVNRESRVLSGESWGHGTVILSWHDVVAGTADLRDGYNVVFHEFAHRLDQESGSANGAPDLPERSMYAGWARVLGREYQGLIDDLEHHRPTELDGYGAESPAEFFAVATEFFFERPHRMRAHHPELYEQFRLFYRRDPATLLPPEPEEDTDDGLAPPVDEAP